jgi:mRNA-degrading endonuclease RelE of RelBE toxin-antitoxin system
MVRIMAIMSPRQPYTLVYARGVTKHLKSIDAKYDSLIRETMEEQLLFEPDLETKNRKPLRQPAPFAAQWEIRFGPDNRFRVLYDIDAEQRTVQIVAIGEKQGNCLIVAGEEVDL